MKQNKFYFNSKICKIRKRERNRRKETNKFNNCIFKNNKI